MNHCGWISKKKERLQQFFRYRIWEEPGGIGTGGEIASAFISLLVTLAEEAPWVSMLYLLELRTGMEQRARR